MVVGSVGKFPPIFPNFSCATNIFSTICGEGTTAIFGGVEIPLYYHLNIISHTSPVSLTNFVHLLSTQQSLVDLRRFINMISSGPRLSTRRCLKANPFFLGTGSLLETRGIQCLDATKTRCFFFVPRNSNLKIRASRQIEKFGNLRPPPKFFGSKKSHIKIFKKKDHHREMKCMIKYQ